MPQFWQEDGERASLDLNAKYGKAKAGRWCKPPAIPDRCYHCPLDNIKPAVGYYIAFGNHRHGVCEDCRAEIVKDHEVIEIDRKEEVKLCSDKLK